MVIIVVGFERWDKSGKYNGIGIDKKFSDFVNVVNVFNVIFIVEI